MAFRLNAFKVGRQVVKSICFGERIPHRCLSSTVPRHHNHGQPSFGLLFDIDGVLVRGKTPIPAAKQCFQNLVDRNGKYRVPVVFVTNAGNCVRQTKAEQLSDLLEVEVSPDQVMLSHSPLRVFSQFHNMCVLVSGQGPVLEVAQNLGFQNVVTIDMLREAYPLLDVVDHHRRPKDMVTQTEALPPIEAVVLVGEPVRWETNLQLIVDVLLTNGKPGEAVTSLNYPHIPVLACNMDLMWMAEAKNPRFGHGMFLVCLENIYKKITGCELKYEALIGKPSVVTYNYAELLVQQQAESLGWTEPVERLYAIGDNPMADIYGANLYNRYLASQQTQRQAQMKGGLGQAGALPKQEAVEEEVGVSKDVGGRVLCGEGCPPKACHSILVCTGVYNHDQRDLPPDPLQTVTERIFHGHRDFRFDPSLIQPSFVVHDVREAVELVFQQEGRPLE
ncbi:haloacid dehalogenase-like hydrolase domain-containing 5 [Conger conger]|uniref:haloacid dehalogenase-like hydrolase domain-containing 5 n=1 Tax=Conger conger TaxID=82655 RepID=UPI002A5984A5|nr:haloacid dehalogenase-like hydrolase domain-containing 5 [Conger conger]